MRAGRLIRGVRQIQEQISACLVETERCFRIFFRNRPTGRQLGSGMNSECNRLHQKQRGLIVTWGPLTSHGKMKETTHQMDFTISFHVDGKKIDAGGEGGLGGLQT